VVRVHGLIGHELGFGAVADPASVVVSLFDGV
jgi:hypothetical protein